MGIIWYTRIRYVRTYDDKKVWLVAIHDVMGVVKNKSYDKNLRGWLVE